jgi:putative acetyltransferase
MEIAPETAADVAGIRQVNQLAFGGDDERRIVDRVRESAHPFISLVAHDHGVAGHILFSPVTLNGNSERLLMGLGPMAVLPARQRQGIGSQLVRAGLDECRRLGVEGVVVVGHPEFYPRFGFSRASAFALTCEFEVPDEVFMAIELTKDAFTGPGGLIRYYSAFSEAS